MGVAALNLPCPGLGLFRVGRLQSGLLCLVAPYALMALFTFGLGHAPIIGYVTAVFALAAALLLLAAAYIVPIALTWRRGARRQPLRWWSRWYSLIAIALATLGIDQFAPSVMHAFYKPFYAPSVSMAPTIGQGDKFVIDMRWRGPLVRGAVIAFSDGAAARVSRIAGLPGDRIAMRNGVPIINGVAASQVVAGHGNTQGTVQIERFPGELSTHAVVDAGPSLFDNMAEVVVPRHHVFVLSDNRDRAADSRVPPSMLGVGMVPASAILGRAMYIHWSANRASIGKRLDR